MMPSEQLREAEEVLKEVKQEMAELIKKEENCKWITYSTEKQQKLYNICDVLTNLIQLHLHAPSELPERMKSMPPPGDPYGLYNNGFNSCLDQVTPIVARLKAENEELEQELEACRDANVQKKKRIADLESSLKRAEISEEDIFEAIEFDVNIREKLSSVQKNFLVDKIHALLTTRGKE